MRSVVFRFESIAALGAALDAARSALPLPDGESVNEGEWILAIFEIGSKKRATAAAARGDKPSSGGVGRLVFERRDWDRLVHFVAARSEHMRAAPPVLAISSAKMPVAAEVAPPSSPSPTPSDAPPRSRRLDDLPSSSAIESSRVPFGARVLVVDGGAAAGDDLCAVLSEMGLVVELVKTTAIAGARMAEQLFDAVVLDLHIPGCDARGFVGQIRTDARASDIPVLFLSSKPTSRDVVDAFAIGGDDFLPKPFRTTELAARIFGLLRRARLARIGAVGR